MSVNSTQILQKGAVKRVSAGRETQFGPKNLGDGNLLCCLMKFILNFKVRMGFSLNLQLHLRLLFIV
jgi:hypothetical protein